MTDRQTDRPPQKLELGTPEAQHVCYMELNKEALLICQAGARRQVKLLPVGAVSVGLQSPGHEYMRAWERRKPWGTSATHCQHQLMDHRRLSQPQNLTSRGRLPFPHSSETVVLDMAGSRQQHTPTQDFIHSEVNY